MRKYSASYTNLDINFCIDTSYLKQQKVNANIKGIVAIVRNILTRGSCINPSEYLQKNIKINKWPSPVSSKSNKLTWNRTIKGGDISNPAFVFYTKYLPRLLQYNEVLYNSFIPECPLNQVVTFDTEIDNYLDFYSPLLKLAIEIDGIQHKKSTLEDSDRDSLLLTHGVQIIRIKTFNIDKPNQTLDSIVKKYNLANHNIVNVINSNAIQYNAIIRYQLAILQLIEEGKLSIYDEKWIFNIVQNKDIVKDAITIAINDLMIYFNNLLILQEQDAVNPKIQIGFENQFKEGLNINLDIFSKYDDSNIGNYIYIRNDYFDYSKDANVQYRNKFKYPEFKNYYKVSNGEIKYKLRKVSEEKHNALLFFLYTIFNFNSFKDNQEDIIVEALQRGNVIGLLPTGAGKSLCYQLTSFLLPGMTLVVSPLKVLMKDQCDNLNERDNITQIDYVSGEHREPMDLFKYNQTKILFVSPERFFNENFLKVLRQENILISLIVIDEVHCLSEWGHDFRTSYLCLMHYFKENTSLKCRIMGLTATASPRVTQDIVAEFNSYKDNPKLIQANSLERDNLNVKVKEFNCSGYKYQENAKYNYLRAFFRNEEKFKDKTLIFTRRKSKNERAYTSCYNLSQQLKRDIGVGTNDNIIDYFSSDDSSNNSLVNDDKLENFKQGKTNILFATKAFGMGVDIPDIRRTIHFELPDSIEGLYQEFGRAGRDGEKSECLIWYYHENQNDFQLLFNSDLTMQNIERKRDNFKEIGIGLYFLSTENLDIDQEVFFELYLYKYMVSNNKNDLVKFSARDFCDYFEKEMTTIPSPEAVQNNLYNNKFKYRVFIDKALYRLYLLGKISMWNVKYTNDLTNPIYDNIYITNNTLDDQVDKLNGYIQRYEPLYLFDINDCTEKSILTELAKWTFNHFIYQKLQSIKNLYQCCNEYKSSEMFMKKITSFLYNDETYSKLISDPNNYDIWFKLLKMVTRYDLKNVISKYLENDDKLVSLNYLSGIVRLLDGEYEDADGEKRLIKALEIIDTYSFEDINKIIRSSFSIIKEDIHREAYVNTLLNYNYKWYRIVDKYYSNELIEQCKIIDLADRTNSIWREINDKCRKN